MNDASEAAILDRLCGLCGIETTYLDVWKRPHQAPQDTKLALLRAMGVDAGDGDGAQAAAALAEAEERRWREALPAATVVRERESPLRVTLVLGADADPAKIDWLLELENGERVAGALRAGTLRELEARDIGGARHVRYALELPIAPEAGYHWFSLRESGAAQRVLAATRLIACPARCFQPAGFAGDLENAGRVWGPALQLYAVRSRRNWGVGDYSDLAEGIEAAAALGAGIVGVNPLHALFPTRPEDASPYSPSSRLALNVLYLDVELIPELAESDDERARVAAPGFQAALRALREKPLVDYAGVARVKLDVLERLYRRFRETALAGDRGRAFRAFQAEGGERLRLHALFEALQERFVAEDPGVWGWPAWPEPYRDPASPEVERFAREHLERVEFWQWLQWHAQTQVARAQRRALELGMPIGLYLDLAVGAHPGGAETWMQRGLYASEASVGAPPDEFNLKGQDWGLPPVIPQRLAQARYEGFVALLRANMRNAGALRIDHVMALMRLFWVPPQASPREGTYVDYPFADLLGILCLESVRNRCIVVGEDLGTVPDEVFTALREHGILSYRPIWFERDGQGGFQVPERYPAQALVTVSTHDLPTLRGFWRGADLETRQRLQLFPDEEVRARQVSGRREDRSRLVQALERAGLAPPGAAPERGDTDDAFMVAVHAYLARTPAKLLTFQMEDVFGEVEQVNLPGTTEDRHPNWRRKLAEDVEGWARDARVLALVEALSRERGPAEPRDRPRRPDAPAAALAIPRATYRLQFNKAFTFADATRIVPYLAALGVSHVYASSWLKARPGSTHGYDITDHASFNPEIGTAEEFDAFARALAGRGMKQLLDIVPNHMGVMGADNAWWLDVLENGPASLYSGYFDIDWEPALPELRGKVLLPVLGSQYGTALESGEIRLAFDAGSGELGVRYFAHRFPLDPRDYPRVLERGIARLAEKLGAGSATLAEYRSLATAFGHLPGRDETAPGKKAERARDKEVRKRELARLCAASPEVARFVEENVAAFQGTKGRTETFDAMHALLEAQAFRLAHWRVAADDINYRRFFDINDLAALRMESEAVFEDTHRLVLRLLGEGKIDALRIDHPDGLYDPRGYFERLQDRARKLRTAPGDAQGRAVYITVEKILAEHERLPEDWPVHGTTGYRFMNVLNGLFVDPAAEARIDRIYCAFIGRRIDYAEVLHRSKIQIMMASLSSELNVLANALSRIAKADRGSRDFTLGALRRALVEIVACFPVYRTYLSGERVREGDRRFVEWAVAAAKKRFHAGETSVFDFIQGVFTGKTVSEGARRMAERFVARFQQFTSPVMAKGVEDTSFYIYNRLASLNEVGGHPLTFGFTLSAFHGASQDRARTWPHTMLASSTHDNKRSEDVRVRIDVLSEIPPAWRLSLRRWGALNRRKKKKVGGEMAPSRNDEYLLYQILLGAWPLEPMDRHGLDAFRERIERYMLKAVREAKVHTSWMNPNEAYEQALKDFIGAILKSFDKNPFLADFVPAQAVIARYGTLNGISQTLVKLTSPGVPDIYQGTELWDLSLVDPDNRRPVDYAKRERVLAQLQSDFGAVESRWPELARDLLANAADGRIKLYLTWRALALRARDLELFEKGGYLPLHATGAHADCVCAYARVHAGRAVVTVAPRFYHRLTGGEPVPPLGERIWGDTRVPLPEKLSRYRDELTGARFGAEDAVGKRSIRLAELLAILPVALLRSE
ncbi:MAG TPA: malto-oligosyltrehalose synthase [Burkholderiales bacterium]|nr:malto-oligosyltrehalose synthase [Burkholderiales bacterium]